jgi:hypothetical protein
VRRLAVDLSKLPAGMARYFITTRNKEEHSMMDVIVLGFLRSPLATPTAATGFEDNGS